MVIIHADCARRHTLAAAFRNCGLNVVAAGAIAEIERWPDDIVVTDLAHFTPVWMRYGAHCVVVLAPNRETGEAACAQGASLWVPSDCDPGLLARLVQSLMAAPCSATAISKDAQCLK